MTLKHIHIINYKNIREAQLSFSPKVNCLIGNNGQGKTNVLDAIYYLSMCRSHITASDNNAVICHNEPYMMLQGEYIRRDSAEEITISLQRGKRKIVRRANKEYKRLSQHIGLLPIVMISPTDWDLIRGGSEERRRFMDHIISQNDHEYLDALIHYNKAVAQRNTMIKNEMHDALLYESIEDSLINNATLIYQRRTQWAQQFLPIFMHYYRLVAGTEETINLIYESHLNQAPMQSLLTSSRERDFIIGYTTRGVHRDDLSLWLNGYPMRQTASQGQCKTYTIALRLAQFEFIKQTSTVMPILLLDDIFDRLDATRVERIIDVVSNNQFGQIFITDTNRTHLDHIINRQSGNHCMMLVQNGNVTRLEKETIA